MATGFNPLGASAYSNTPKISMVQPAIPVKDWRYYEKTIIAMEDGTGKLYKEYKEGGAWKEQYKTWEDACIPLGKSRSQVDRIILQDTTIRASCANTPTQQKKETLKAIAKLPEPSEEPEKPHIKTADEIKAEQAETDKPPVDLSGCPVPQHLIEKRDDYLMEVQNAVGWASKLKCLFEDCQNGHTAPFEHVKASGNLQTFTNGASAMYSALRECLPEVVCPQCQAKAKTCHVCHGSGWISQVRWNRDWVKSHDAQRLAEVKRRSNGK